MEKARILVVEDGDVFRSFIRRFLAKTNHTIAAEASTLDAALEEIARAARGEIEFDVVLLDGNLSKGAMDCADAHAVVKSIEEKGLSLVVIDIAGGLTLKQAGVSADIELGKSELAQLPQILDRL